MVAVTDRCHACGTRRAPSDQFCERCGQPLPEFRAPSTDPSGFEQTPAGLTWVYRIPVVTNRYTWIKWGWVSLWTWVGLTTAAIALLILLAPSHGKDPMVLVRLAGALAFVATCLIVALGLFGALVAGGGVQARYALDSRGVAISGPMPGSGEGMLMAFTDPRSAQSTAETARALLPSNDGSARWDSVRRVEFDDTRHVISLRRRWHHPLRIYVPTEHFQEVGAFVRTRFSTTRGGSALPSPPPDLAQRNTSQ